MESRLVRGTQAVYNNQSKPNRVDFYNVTEEIRVNYAEVILKARLTECLEQLSRMVYDKHEKKLDLINIVDNIVKNINIQNFVNILADANYINIFSDMIYNEMYRMIVYMRTLYSEVDYNGILLFIDNERDNISRNILSILGKLVK